MKCKLLYLFSNPSVVLMFWWTDCFLIFLDVKIMIHDTGSLDALLFLLLMLH